MIIESLPQHIFDENMQDFSRCEERWRVMEDIDINFVKKSMEETIEILKLTRPGEDASDLKWENVEKRLEAGRVVDDPLLLYRVKNDLPKCPLCGASYDEAHRALSRRDNKTSICSNCGVREAFNDYLVTR